MTTKINARSAGAAVRRAWRLVRHPVVLFGLALAALVWIGAAVIIYLDSDALKRQGVRDAENFSLVMEQDIAQTVNSIDRVLRLLQWLDKQQNHKTDWPAVLEGEHRVDKDMVQTAVTDAKGWMLSSSSAPRPMKPVDLSDREHIRVQLESKRDELFISKVVIGRVSGESSIQFTRRLIGEAGETLGVVVLSLPPNHFDRNFAKLDLGEGGGVYVVGDDGLARIGTGVFSNVAGARVNLDSIRARNGFVSVRRVEGAPLTVVASLPGLENDPRWRFRRSVYFGAAGLISFVALLAAFEVAARRQRHEEQIVHISRVDTLTDLANRRALGESLDSLTAPPALHRAFALHIIDLDRFKMVNDTYGHATGDELLKGVGLRLRDLVGPQLLIARLGGDEFALLQPVVDYLSEASALAESVCRGMSRPFWVRKMSLQIGATVGVSCFDRDGGEGTELMKAADLALYAAKAAGRGGYRLYSPDLADSALRRLSIETGLRSALANDELRLVYQPIVSTGSGEVIGFEALMRWRRPGAEAIGPAEFIPVAEDIGLIGDIGAWALRRACAEIAAMPGAYAVAVNCSPAQFATADFDQTIVSALSESGLAPHRLTLEITESMLMKDRRRIVEQLDALRALGVGVSIDDFGSGYSCLSYLEIYPISTLKIDQMFVAKIGRRREALDTLRAIIELAASFGMTTVAEGVEQPEQLLALRELGCTAAQGYYLGRPGELERFAATRASVRSAA